ncbi:amidohydrolase family protein (plasmid) [Polymorphobacter sp. PAMC 29334]|nr:amidohydrolase family protein [Polymorphobacter sp. PAMC 29334]
MATTDALEEAGSIRLADMDRAGITMQVLSAGGPGADLLSAEEGLRFARDYNDQLRRIADEHPTRFSGFAHLPMAHPEAAADELDRAVTHLGLKGALINGTTRGLFLDAPGFEPILSRAASLGVPLYLHPSPPPAAVRSAYYADLPEEASMLLSGPGFGWHAETALHVLRLVVSGTLARHPRLKLIIGHMGEGLPAMMGRADEVFTSFAARQLDRSIARAILDQVWITTSGLFTLPPFIAALLTFGADRILFSVDYPFSSNAIGAEFLRCLPVSPADRTRIAHGNADALLSLR